jgi:hypothetical protein
VVTRFVSLKPEVLKLCARASCQVSRVKTSNQYVGMLVEAFS